jgi:hypothetical protein
MGFDEDLNEAMKIAVRQIVNFLAEQKNGAHVVRRSLLTYAHYRVVLVETKPGRDGPIIL